MTPCISDLFTPFLDCIGLDDVNEVYCNIEVSDHRIPEWKTRVISGHEPNTTQIEPKFAEFITWLSKYVETKQTLPMYF
jgi:hypothetical protein